MGNIKICMQQLKDLGKLHKYLAPVKCFWAEKNMIMGLKKFPDRDYFPTWTAR